MAITPPIGNEIVYIVGVQQNGMPAPRTREITTQMMANLQANSMNALLTTVPGNTPLALTGAQLGTATDTTIILSAALAAAGTATLPTVASLAAVYSLIQVNTSWNLRIINASSGAFSWTIATNTGWTLAGTMTIAQNTSRDFIVQFTSATTATLTTVGTGTYS